MEVCDDARTRLGEVGDADVLWLLESCGSPLEQVFLAYLCAVFSVRETYLAECIIDLSYVERRAQHDGMFHILIEPQREVSINGARYRADFGLSLVRGRVGAIGWRRWRRAIAIEIDGHDFHEKTPEQAARDKRRDRDFSLTGITPLRFTGREIHRQMRYGSAEWSVMESITDHVEQLKACVFDAYVQAGQVDRLLRGDDLQGASAGSWAESEVWGPGTEEYECRAAS